MRTILTLIFIFCTKTAIAERLPSDVVDLLDRDFSGWKLYSLADHCRLEESKSLVKGDFNGDEISDYAIKFLQGDVGHIVAIISNPTGLKSIVLESGSRDQITNQGLGMVPGGSQIYVNFNFSEGNTKLLLINDTPTGGQCESTSYLYLIQEESFILGLTSD